ncbi:hypothetical protein GWK47_029040 [Chionoecetes opilio]|uniref:Uncharacterized protein n=1 Tax=Chionoecetes opilio TaxID=41210 RepID=A0A8J4YNB4_CHIOP|nr:hypothetical protein GWK47_029040 [Chionoecetes opilio]
MSMDDLGYSIPHKDNMIPKRKGQGGARREPLYQPWVRKRGLHICVPTGRPRPCKWERSRSARTPPSPKMPGGRNGEEGEGDGTEEEAKVEAVRQKMEMEREARPRADAGRVGEKEADVLWEEVRGMREAEQDTLIKVKRERKRPRPAGVLPAA